MRTALAVLALALVLPVSAYAGDGPGHHKHHHHHHPAPPPAPDPTPPPPPAPQVNAVSFCVATDKGWTYVQLTAGAFDPGTYWRNLYDTGATVPVAGNVVTFTNIGDKGIYLAPTVPGVGSTCAIPHVCSCWASGRTWDRTSFPPNNHRSLPRPTRHKHTPNAHRSPRKRGGFFVSGVTTQHHP